MEQRPMTALEQVIYAIRLQSMTNDEIANLLELPKDFIDSLKEAMENYDKTGNDDSKESNT
jgi:hypothetical protein